jgi:hypothetical protein
VLIHHVRPGFDDGGGVGIKLAHGLAVGLSSPGFIQSVQQAKLTRGGGALQGVAEQTLESGKAVMIQSEIKIAVELVNHLGLNRSEIADDDPVVGSGTESGVGSGRRFRGGSLWDFCRRDGFRPGGLGGKFRGDFFGCLIGGYLTSFLGGKGLIRGLLCGGSRLRSRLRGRFRRINRRIHGRLIYGGILGFGFIHRLGDGNNLFGGILAGDGGIGESRHGSPP